MLGAQVQFGCRSRKRTSRALKSRSSVRGLELRAVPKPPPKCVEHVGLLSCILLGGPGGWGWGWWGGGRFRVTRPRCNLSVPRMPGGPVGLLLAAELSGPKLCSANVAHAAVPWVATASPPPQTRITSYHVMLYSWHVNMSRHYLLRLNRLYHPWELFCSYKNPRGYL